MQDSYLQGDETYGHNGTSVQPQPRVEPGYRGLEKRPSNCLKDTIDSCICIMGRGGVRPEEYLSFFGNRRNPGAYLCWQDKWRECRSISKRGQ